MVGNPACGLQNKRYIFSPSTRPRLIILSFETGSTVPFRIEPFNLYREASSALLHHVNQCIMLEFYSNDVDVLAFARFLQPGDRTETITREPILIRFGSQISHNVVIGAILPFESYIYLRIVWKSKSSCLLTTHFSFVHEV